jgi:hypothetical protein
METLICKKQGCEQPAAPNQVYCSAACAPFAYIGAKPQRPHKPTMEKPKEAPKASVVHKVERTSQASKNRGRTFNNELLAGIRKYAGHGYTRSEIAARLGTSYSLVTYYSKKFLIPIPSRNIPKTIHCSTCSCTY